MPCPPLMCCGAADCPDVHCPGNPVGVAAYMDEQDRQAEVHAAVMAQRLERASFLPREQATTPKRIAARQARNRNHFFLTLAVIGALVLARLVLRILGVI